MEKNNKKYYFVTPESDQLLNRTHLPDIKFYQISGFINPETNKHNLRVYFIDGNNSIVNYKNFNITKKMMNDIKSSVRENTYKIYPTYSLDHIDPPSCNDIMLARSQMLNIDNEYYGFAKF